MTVKDILSEEMESYIEDNQDVLIKVYFRSNGGYQNGVSYYLSEYVDQFNEFINEEVREVKYFTELTEIYL